MRAMGRRLSRSFCIVFLSAYCSGFALAADWQPIDLKFPKVEDKASLNITAIGIAGPDQVYLAATGSLLYLWNGKSLEQIKHDESGDPEWEIRNIVVNAADDVWVFGDNGLSIRFDGKSWQHVRNPLTGTGKRKGRLWGAACAQPDLCFAGSHNGRLIKWDGKKWQDVKSPVDDARIYGMQLTSPNSGWMVGTGFFASWDGKSWEKADLKDVPGMYGLAMVGQDWGWAVGDAGKFYVYDGKNWRPSAVKGSLFRLRSIACTNKTFCWTVGEAGIVFKWNGEEWQRVKLGTTDRLVTVQMTPRTNLIGGDRATLLQYQE